MTDQLSHHPILPLVEDDRVLEPVLEAALSDDGFEVLTAATGAKAISELEANGNRLKGSATDIRLGSGLSGREVRHRARQLVPGIP
jgi:DNA-binding response OmpR family regulator